MGFEMAFMGDPLLAGMLAARASEGISHRIRSVALMEAKEEAKKAKDAGKQQIAVRELVGPRGGLPIFRQDLLKQSALFHLDVSEKDTNATLRENVDRLMESMPKSAKAKAEAKSSSRSSQEQAPLPLANGPVPVWPDPPPILQEPPAQFLSSMCSV